MAGGIGRAGTASSGTARKRHRAGTATHCCPIDGPQTEPSSSRARVSGEGVCGPGFVQPVAIAGGGPHRFPDLDRGKRKTRRPCAEGPRGQHDMPNAATTPARNTLREGLVT
jgi:hypothetical protein